MTYSVHQIVESLKNLDSNMSMSTIKDLAGNAADLITKMSEELETLVVAPSASDEVQKAINTLTVARNNLGKEADQSWLPMDARSYDYVIDVITQMNRALVVSTERCKTLTDGVARLTEDNQKLAQSAPNPVSEEEVPKHRIASVVKHLESATSVIRWIKALDLRISMPPVDNESQKIQEAVTLIENLINEGGVLYVADTAGLKTITDRQGLLNHFDHYIRTMADERDPEVQMLADVLQVLFDMDNDVVIAQEKAQTARNAQELSEEALRVGEETITKLRKIVGQYEADLATVNQKAKVSNEGWETTSQELIKAREEAGLNKELASSLQIEINNLNISLAAKDRELGALKAQGSNVPELFDLTYSDQARGIWAVSRDWHEYILEAEDIDIHHISGREVYFNKLKEAIRNLGVQNNVLDPKSGTTFGVFISWDSYATMRESFTGPIVSMGTFSPYPTVSNEPASARSSDILATEAVTEEPSKNYHDTAQIETFINRVFGDGKIAVPLDLQESDVENSNWLIRRDWHNAVTSTGLNPMTSKDNRSFYVEVLRTCVAKMVEKCGKDIDVTPLVKAEFSVDWDRFGSLGLHGMVQWGPIVFIDSPTPLLALIKHKSNPVVPPLMLKSRYPNQKHLGLLNPDWIEWFKVNNPKDADFTQLPSRMAVVSCVSTQVREHLKLKEEVPSPVVMIDWDASKALNGDLYFTALGYELTV